MEWISASLCIARPEPCEGRESCLLTLGRSSTTHAGTLCPVQDKHRLPIFEGCVICVTGTEVDREEVERLCGEEYAGAIYSKVRRDPFIRLR